LSNSKLRHRRLTAAAAAAVAAQDMLMMLAQYGGYWIEPLGERVALADAASVGGCMRGLRSVVTMTGSWRYVLT